jgi:hypothetical protein
MEQCGTAPLKGVALWEWYFHLLKPTRYCQRVISQQGRDLRYNILLRCEGFA